MAREDVMTIQRAKDVLFNEDGSLNKKALFSCIQEHNAGVERLSRLADYYDGEHDILRRERNIEGQPNNRIVVNHAEYITDFATAYFMGNPIKYTFPNEDNIKEDDELLRAFRVANIDLVDTKLSRDLSIFGKAIELTYQDGEAKTKSVRLDPRTAFLVIDDTSDQIPLLGVQRITMRDEDNAVIGEKIVCSTANQIITYELKNSELEEVGDAESNPFREVPLIEYANKANQKGDFETVIPLIDAYNLLQSDRINDKEQFVDSLLVLYGVLAGDTDEEKVETARRLKSLGLLEIPEGNSAEYLTRSFHESEVETLKSAIVEDIHKVSKVPNLTDKNFAGNSSGVAMKYKLLGLEQLAQTKEGYYREGLKRRLKLYKNILNIKAIDIDVDDVQISFTRSLPANEVEIGSLVASLKDMVSHETLLSLLPFVEDTKLEVERVKEQQLEKMKQAQLAFGGYDIPDDGVSYGSEQE